MFCGFQSCVAEDFVTVGHDALSVGNRIPTTWRKSQCNLPVIEAQRIEMSLYCIVLDSKCGPLGLQIFGIVNIFRQKQVIDMHRFRLRKVHTVIAYRT
jgi:hypothetical protein